MATNNSHFAVNPTANIQRSTFNRSHSLKTTLNAGYLVPIFIDEALPGDTFTLNLAHFARLATPIVPVMDNMWFDTFFFAVPNRLVWDNWQKFMGEQKNPGDSTDYLIPICEAPAVTGYGENTIFDYFQLPTKTPNFVHSVLPLRAYNLIYNEWFRDQNLQNSVQVNRTDGPDLPTDYTLLRRGKRHDYFTSALPWPQKGEAVQIPIADTANILRTSSANQWQVYHAGSNTLASNTTVDINNTATGNLTKSGVANLSLDPNGGLYADLSLVAGTINELREAFQLQKLYERDARGGTRYTEIIKSHFGVTSPDARLQRPEYLGGSSNPININPIAQTSATDATSPQGNLAAFGTTSGHGQGFTKSFTEHCIIIGLCSIRAEMSYQNGLDRMWSRQTKYDFYWPTLAHLGEQAILNQEMTTLGIPADQDVWGYQERYAEYRYKNSKVTGLFRSNATASLDFWHLAQDFASLPTLSSTFIQENPPIDRIIAVPSEPHLLLDCYFQMKCARPMPTYSIPGLVDHF